MAPGLLLTLTFFGYSTGALRRRGDTGDRHTIVSFCFVSTIVSVINAADFRQTQNDCHSIFGCADGLCKCHSRVFSMNGLDGTS